METNNYYNVGTVDDPVVSSSSISHLMPEEGGSVVKFFNFFRRDEEKITSLALERGKLIHKYIEDPDSFVVADDTAPSDMMKELVDRLIPNCLKAQESSLWYDPKEVTTAITSVYKRPSAVEADIQEAEMQFEKLSKIFTISRELAIISFRIARQNAFKNKKEATILQDITEGDVYNYIQFRLKSKNKIILNTTEKEKVLGAVTSLQTHPKVKRLLRIGTFDDFDDPLPVVDLYKELPIYWQELVDPQEGATTKVRTRINCKALLDNLQIDHQAKTITYSDLKSTTYSIYQFQDAFESYRIYRQQAVYKRAIQKWFPTRYPDIDYRQYKHFFNVVPVETNGLYLCGVYPVTDEWLIKGTQEFRSFLGRFAWHMQTGERRFSKEEILNGGFLQLKNPI